jgi:hypothetical protein
LEQQAIRRKEMRDIIFRGKRVKDGKWGYGSLFSSMTGQKFIRWEVDDDGEIEGIVRYEVIPETVGQFIGLLDKNGKKIFEGDIVRIEDFANAVVKWREDIACWTLQGYIIGNTWDSSMLEVIGNIHDNPELLEGGTC